MAVFTQHRDIVVSLVVHVSIGVVPNSPCSIYLLRISQINKNEQMANLVFMSKKSPKIPCQDVDFFSILSIIKTKAY